MVHLKTLRSRFLTLGMLAIIPSVALLMALYAVAESRDIRAADASRVLSQETSLIATAHDQVIAETHNLFVAMAAHPALAQAESGRCTEILARLLDGTRGYSTFLLVASNGDLVCGPQPTDDVISLVDRRYYQEAMRTRSFTVGEYIVGRVSGKAVLPMAYPILDDNGEVRLLLAAGKTLDWMKSIISEQHKDQLTSVSVVDHNGTLLARFPHDDAGLGQPFHQPEVRDAIANEVQGSIGTLTDSDGRTYAFSRLSTSIPDVFVIAEAPADAFAEEIDAIYRRNIALTLGAAILAFAAIWFANQRLVFAPMNSLLTAIQRMKGGDLSARTGVRTRIGEISELAEAFDEMAGNLEDRDRQLLQAQKMEAVGHLTGGVAHDFNNLLTVIIGNLQLIERAAGDDERLRRRVSTAQEAALRGGELTKRLLAFSRRQVLEPKVLDLNELVSSLETLLRQSVDATIDVDIQLGGDIWPTRVDPNQLETALLNLVINARDAMPEGGRLTIETATAQLDEAYAACHSEVAAGDYVLLTVSDTGTGMSPEVQARVFDPFFTTKEVGKGSGLGLSMVYGFVKQSGGHIKIYSELGHGTSLKIYLPNARGEIRAAEIESSAYAPDSAGGETILVAEDDAEVRKTAVALLEELNYRVLAAEDGPAALAILDRREAVDLLFTDLVMPGGMTGIELAGEARRRRPELKVLCSSGYSEAVVSRGGLDLQAEWIGKPYRRDDLARKVRQVLDTGPPEPVGSATPVPHTSQVAGAAVP